jgi:hypothetical protein
VVNCQEAIASIAIFASKFLAVFWYQRRHGPEKLEAVVAALDLMNDPIKGTISIAWHL